MFKRKGAYFAALALRELFFPFCPSLGSTTAVSSSGLSDAGTSNSGPYSSDNTSSVTPFSVSAVYSSVNAS